MKEKKSFPAGMHGYNPEYKEMHGIFMASGPSFKNGVVVPSFQNINIYGIIAHSLDLDFIREHINKTEIENLFR